MTWISNDFHTPSFCGITEYILCISIVQNVLVASIFTFTVAALEILEMVLKYLLAKAEYQHTPTLIYIDSTHLK